MKKIILLLIFTLSAVIISSSSFSEWKRTFIIGKGLATYYIDFDRVRKNDGYVYWWSLIDFTKAINGNLSMMGYNQGDCKMFRQKLLSLVSYKENMGKGAGKTTEGSKKWEYPQPNTANENILRRLCVN